MFISFKLNKTYLYMAVLIIIVIIAAILILPKINLGVLTSAKGASLKVDDEVDISSYLSSLGLSVGTTAKEFCEVTIPKEFDRVYAGYNEIQKESGFDLSKYGGKRVKKYTFEVNAFPGEENGTVFANVIVYKGKIIGGDILSTRLDGFLIGLKGVKDTSTPEITT